VASASLAVFLGLVTVNLVLNSRDRRMAAAPLLSLIANLHEKLHNELFIRAGWDKFGSARFGQLIDMYTESKGSPEAFAPEELESLYQMIISKKAELIDVYSKIEANARDMAAILGWGYDARILGAILSVRSNILSFMNLLALPAHDQPSKKKIVEHYLDIEGSMSAWGMGLAKKLGSGVKFGD
jgi:hypothetical protein